MTEDGIGGFIKRSALLDWLINGGTPPPIRQPATVFPDLILDAPKVTPKPDDVEIGVGRYGLRTFRPKIVRGMPHLCSVSQDAIPNLDPRIPIDARHRELMVETHPVAWEDGTCKATCQRARRTAMESWGGSIIGTLQEETALHNPPERKCGCGIYALDDLKDLHSQYKAECEHVVAVISASGRTIECNNGIRTKYARVVAYWVLDHPQECTCRLCGHRWNSVGDSWAKSEFIVDGKFPYLACAMTQFRNATRWNEPDEMAKHYGLKATPIPPPIIPRRAAPGRVPTLFPGLAPNGYGHFTAEIPIS